MKNWYRIELDDSGAILSCEQVPESERINTKHVRYVEAIDKAEACDEVKRWYQKYRETANRLNRERRARIRTLGLCTSQCLGCTGKPEGGKKTCESCRAKNRAAVDARKRRRANGDMTDLRGKQGGAEERRAIFLNNRHKQSNKRYLALGGIVMRGDVLRKFDELGASGFRVWLVSEIEKFQVARGYVPESQAPIAAE